MLHTVRRSVASELTSQKDRAADGLRQVDHAVARMGDDLDDQNIVLALLAHGASRGLARASGRLRERSASELGQSVAHFARRRPAVFVGCAFLVGLALGRVLQQHDGP
ncbi:MAG: hypothetical protein R2712_07870 [Vicinamibacterales bacterium]